VRLSLLVALAIDPATLRRSAGCAPTWRLPIGTRRWRCSPRKTKSDAARIGGGSAWDKLSEPRIQIPFQEHRELHLTIYRRLDNPFVVGLLEAYWDAYEAVELNTYADLAYLQAVWRYHEAIVAAICGEVAEGKRLLVEHMQLLNARGAPMEMTAPTPIALALA
jgi:DNA-binding FadR family transcriptional regulator